MNLNELAFVLNYILTEVSATHLQEKYQELVSALNELQTASTDELQTKVEVLRSEIKGIHKKINPVGWTSVKKSLFLQLHGEEIIGLGGSDQLMEVFSGYATLGPQGAASRVQELLAKIQAFVSSMTQLKTSLGTAGEFEDTPLPEGKVLMEIVFDKNVGIKSIEQLEERANDWKRIFTSYQRLFAESQGEVEIISVNKENPFSWLLVVPAVFAQIFEKTVAPILRVRNTWLKGQILAERLRRMKMGSHVLKRKWEDSEKVLEAEVVEQVTKKIIKLHKRTIPKGQAAEVTEFIKHNTEDILKFIKGGGSVDVSTKADGTFTVRLKLARTYDKMYQLKDKAENLLTPPKLEPPEPEEAAQEEPEAVGKEVE